VSRESHDRAVSGYRDRVEERSLKAVDRRVGDSDSPVVRAIVRLAGVARGRDERETSRDQDLGPHGPGGSIRHDALAVTLAQPIVTRYHARGS
jgi:hypothetical protein